MGRGQSAGSGAAAPLPRVTPTVFVTPVGQAIQVGDRAPLIVLKDQNGSERRSDQLEGRPLVLFFYPKDDTPGCTMEACAFRDNHAELQALGAEVWGVSGDDGASHGRFSQRHQLPYPLLVDQGNSLRQAFGVPGALLNLLPGRVTYVIDGEGMVRHVFNNLLDGPAHAREAMAALKRLVPQA
jgi:thioredoxin-dependent peroxiredoxin